MKPRFPKAVSSQPKRRAIEHLAAPAPLVLGLGASRPRKGVEGYLWFREVPPPDLRKLLFDAVPMPFHSARQWKAPRVLAIGTADDIRAWCSEVGGWDALRDQLLGYLKEAHERSPLAFYASSDGFTSRRRIADIVRLVLPAIEAHFAESPVPRSAHSDPGVWTVYYALAGTIAPAGTGMPLHCRERWHSVFRAAIGRSFSLDCQNADYLGPHLLQESMANGDGLTMLAFHRKLPPDVDMAGLALRAIDGGRVSVEWLHEMMVDVLGAYIGVLSFSDVAQAELRPVNRARLDAAWTVAQRLPELGPSDQLASAASLAQWIARATGRWEAEVGVVRFALSRLNADRRRLWGSRALEAVLNKARELGDDSVLNWVISEIRTNYPTLGRMVLLGLKVLIAKGRVREAADLVDYYERSAEDVDVILKMRWLIARAQGP